MKECCRKNIENLIDKNNTHILCIHKIFNGVHTCKKGQNYKIWAKTHSLDKFFK